MLFRSFTKFLECGIPEYGFIRTYCYHCRHSGVVPFSCKKRGFCPSCCAKRMNNEAAHLVDVVLPEIPYRQWVLSFPYKLRFLMARNQELTNAALKIFHHTIGSFQKKKAKKKRSWESSNWRSNLYPKIWIRTEFKYPLSYAFPGWRIPGIRRWLCILQAVLTISGRANSISSKDSKESVKVR